jgi:hypothetical protein
VKARLEAAEPERGRKELESAEDIPQQGLTGSLIFDCLRTSDWPTEAVGMMRRDHDLLSNGFDG